MVMNKNLVFSTGGGSFMSKKPEITVVTWTETQRFDNIAKTGSFKKGNQLVYTVRRMVTLLRAGEKQ